MSSYLGKILYRKRMTLQEACIIAGVEFEPGMTVEGYDQCHSCSQWFLEKELHPDMDGIPICKTCEGWYGY